MWEVLGRPIACTQILVSVMKLKCHVHAIKRIKLFGAPLKTKSVQSIRESIGTMKRKVGANLGANWLQHWVHQISKEFGCNYLEFGCIHLKHGE